MFVFMSKLLPTLAYPLGLVSLLILAALFLGRRVRLQRMVLIIALVLVWLGGNRWVASGLARSLEGRYQTPNPIPQADVLVLLGGGTSAPEPPRTMVEVNSAGDRVIYAARLYEQGKASHILASGGLLDWDVSDTTPAQDMAALLMWMGVPEDVIWLQGDSRNTYEDALFSARILEAKGADIGHPIERILLVTSAWHMPRAVKLFEAQGLEVIPLPTDYNVTQKGWERAQNADWRSYVLDFFPSVGNLGLTTRMLKEYFGLFIYGLRGWTE
jgi:uncharacterized SAM-binding protein YcdF (DUF218 family)